MTPICGTVAYIQAELSEILPLDVVFHVVLQIAAILLLVLLLDAHEVQSVPVQPHQPADEQLVPVFLIALAGVDIAFGIPGAGAITGFLRGRQIQ